MLVREDEMIRGKLKKLLEISVKTQYEECYECKIEI